MSDVAVKGNDADMSPKEAAMSAKMQP